MKNKNSRGNTGGTLYALTKFSSAPCTLAAWRGLSDLEYMHLFFCFAWHGSLLLTEQTFVNLDSFYPCRLTLPTKNIWVK